MSDAPEETGNPFDPTPEGLPLQVGLFPLSGVLLLPGGQLPLNVFEPRFLHLVQDALGAGRMLGMIQPAQEDRSILGEGAEQPDLFRVGCLGRITQFSETDDGRFYISLKGLARFRLQQPPALTEHGYLMATVAYQNYTADLKPEADFTLNRKRMMAALDMMIRKRGAQLDHAMFDQMTAAEMVAAVAMVAPFGATEKQALLEAETGAERAEILMTLLEMAAFDGTQPPNTRQ